MPVTKNLPNSFNIIQKPVVEPQTDQKQTPILSDNSHRDSSETIASPSLLVGAIHESEPFSDFKKLVERGSITDWSYVLTEKENPLRLSSYMNSDTDYYNEGYSNLLISIFENNLTNSNISKLFSGDKFTSRAAEFISNLRKNGFVKYQIPSSDEDYAFEAFKIMTGNPQTKGKKTVSKKTITRKTSGTFQDSQHRLVSMTREEEFDKGSSRLVTVTYRNEIDPAV